jgi:hypothetical protein
LPFAEPLSEEELADELSPAPPSAALAVPLRVESDPSQVRPSTVSSTEVCFEEVRDEPEALDASLLALFARLASVFEWALLAGLLAALLLGAPEACFVALSFGVDALRKENTSVPGTFAEPLEPDPRVAFEADEEPILSATGYHSIRPRTLRAFVRFALFALVQGVLLIGLEALHHLSDGFGALRGTLPGLQFAIALRARPDDHLSLLPQRLFEAGEKGLVVARHDCVHAGLGAQRKIAYVACVVGLELGELRFVFRDAALGAGESFRFASLLVVDDVLNHFQSLCALHSSIPQAGLAASGFVPSLSASTP